MAIIKVAKVAVGEKADFAKIKPQYLGSLDDVFNQVRQIVRENLNEKRETTFVMSDVKPDEIAFNLTAIKGSKELKDEEIKAMVAPAKLDV